MSENTNHFEDGQFEEREERLEDIRDEVSQPEIEQEDREETEDSIEPVKKAKSFGHMSKEEWERQGRDPTKWKSPEQFNEFGDSYSKLKPHIETLKKEISKRDTALDTIIEHINEVKEKEYLRGKAEVEYQLQQAREMGDVRAVEDLTAMKIKAEQEEFKNSQSRMQQEQQAADQSFLERNKHWYNANHPEMMQAAQRAAQEIRELYPRDSFSEVARKVEARMKYDHPDVVGSNNRPASSAISPSRSSINKSAMESSPESEDRAFRSLDADQRAEFKWLEKLLAKSSIKYSVKEYMQKQNISKTNRG